MTRALLTILLLCASGLAIAGEPSGPEAVDYATQIKPLLAKHCYACHSALKQEGDLRLDTAQLAIRGGSSGPAIVPGESHNSLLVARLAAADAAERMPQEGEPLAPDQIDLFKRWIDAQAPAPADEQPEADPRQHWAFQPVQRPAVPATSWGRNPIDAFIAAALAEQGLAPQREADRAVLIRRTYLDLIGIPPTVEEWRTWLAADAADWHQQLVEQLLADPRYGERWGRHWLDIWRYSDWWGLGDQHRNSQPHIWHWRDWVIESINADLPYDEMLRLMLAADESHPNDLGRLRATGFLARNYFLFNRHQWLDEAVEHVGKGLLGLTFNCAKCHDHKYDPIDQVDYYRMRAFFEPYHARVDMLPGEVDLARDGIPRVFDGAPVAPTYVFVRGQETQPDTSREVAPGVPAILDLGELLIEPISLPRDAVEPARRAWVSENYLAAAARGVEAATRTHAGACERCTAEPSSETEAARRIAELELAVANAELGGVRARMSASQARWAHSDGSPDAPELAARESAARLEAILAERKVAVAKAELAVEQAVRRLAEAPADKKEAPDKELVKAREALDAARQAAAAEVPADANFTPLVGAKWTPTRFLSSLKDDPEIAFPASSTGRRTALAQWITNPRHPLTARVAVNHIWNRHFGTPLVATVFDFGRNGSGTPHTHLLDWLAAEFVEQGWSMKHIHRLLTTSAVYRLSSSNAGAADSFARDPDNRWLWRRSPIRLEAEVVRDSLVALAGRLEDRVGGPPVPAAEQASSPRRSLYFFHSNNDRNPFLTTFDVALVKECYRRDQSIVPQQALALANSQLVHESLAEVTARLEAACPGEASDDTFVRWAMLALLGIEATQRELAACRAALDHWSQLPADDGAAPASAAPRARLVWALINHNDFVTLR